MQDAQLSCKQAVETVCTNTTVLMCFFHVMSNIKQFQKSNKTLVTDDDFNLIIYNQNQKRNNSNTRKQVNFHGRSPSNSRK